MIKGHGNNIYDYKSKIKIDFSSNIAFNSQSDKVIEHLRERMYLVNNYPDPEALELKSRLVEHHQRKNNLINVSESEILVVNGSAEAFYLIAYMLSEFFFAREGKCRTCILTPSFAEYEDSCKLYKHSIDYLDIKEFENQNFEDYNSVWLGVPNNPNAYVIEIKQVLEKCRLYADTYFVIDLAYSSLCLGFDIIIDKLPPNLIIINSLTKSFGIPGLRLGYLIAEESLIANLSNMRPPWNVNALALEAGKYILDHYDSLKPNLEELLAESKFLQFEIQKIKGINIFPSNTNFFLCELVPEELNSAIDVSRLKNDLVEQYGILIRDCSNFRTLSTRHFRIAAQSREFNMALIMALKHILQN